jgi:rod shape-determining protein MreB
VVDLGGGASEAAVVSMNGIVSAHTVRTGGMKLDEAIISYVRKKYGLVIGDPTAEEIKIQIGAAYPLDEELTMEVQGRDQVNGLPRSVIVNSGEVVEALQEPMGTIVGAVKTVLEKTPPELASDIIDRGMVLCGGGSLLRNIDKLLTKETGVPAYVAENPLACVALGTSKAFRHLDLLRRVLGRP